MPNLLAALLAFLQLVLPLLSPQVLTERLRSGEWLRFHVIAQDDTQEMQRVKLCVRDAVQESFRKSRPAAASMRTQAEAILPELTQAAEAAARNEGFTGRVEVLLEVLPFDDRELNSIPVPAGDYPALVIRLGDAQGRNWWGLLDPALSQLFTQVPSTADEPDLIWDWSLQALLSALLGLSMTAEGA